MELILAHLSDIHISRATDPVATRGAQIASAIVASTGATVECLIVCTGDIAWSGKKDEYDIAAQLFLDIDKELRSQGRSPTFVFLPGNHDCDFSGGDPVRSMLVDAIRKEPKQAREAEVQKHCIRVQHAFRSFVSELQSKISCLSFSDDLRSEHDYHGNRLQLLNSAWMSSLHEGSGSLVFPEASLSRDLNAFTITCLHHPPHWYTPMTRRDLWRAIAQGSDVVLTGHEHEPDQASIESRADHTLHSHFEAGALQSHSDQTDSVFSVYVIDKTARTCRTYVYSWKDETKQYSWNGVSQEHPRPPEEPLPLNRIRSVRQFEFKPKHALFLSALTMNITHQVVGTLTLPDIFIYPDLSSTKLAVEPSGIKDSILHGKDLLPMAELMPMILITGEKYAGKTALAKTLCADMHERGFVPVFLQPSKKLRTANAWIDAVERSFCEQYHDGLLARFQQLAPSTRAIIVDDADVCVDDSEEIVSHLLSLSKYAGRIILLSETVALDPKVLIRLLQASIPHYQIKPFGYLQREQLLQKWLLLGRGQMDAAALVRKLHETTKTIDGIVGKGFVPSYPFFVLTLLHAADSAVQLEARTSAQGYYFEQLIRTELLRGKQEHAKLDVTLGTLSFIAFKFFTGNVDRMSDHDLRRVVQEFEDLMALDLDYGSLMNHLVDRRMLALDEGEYSFAYDYVYYFFVARYLARNIDQESIKESVRMLCRATDRRKYGDILLFLAHFSNDSFVISEMVNGANEAFKDQPQIDLKKDLAVLTDIKNALDECTYEDKGDALTVRNDLMVQRDAVNETQKISRGADRADRLPDDLEVLNRLIAAIRNMEVVGQVLKNNPGHLDGTKKLEIASAAYGVGARIWRWMLHLLAEGQRELVEDLIREARRDNPGISPEQLRESIGGALVGLVRLGSLGMVKRIALSIGAPELDATYRKLVETVGGDAALLTYLSIRLDCMPGIQTGEVTRVYREISKNPIAAWIIRQLVLEHLHLFQLEPADKQALCAAVEIQYKSGLGVGQRQKLLPKPQ